MHAVHVNLLPTSCLAKDFIATESHRLYRAKVQHLDREGRDAWDRGGWATVRQMLCDLWGTTRLHQPGTTTDEEAAVLDD